MKIEVRDSEDKRIGVIPAGEYSIDLAPGVYTLAIAASPSPIRSESFSVKIGETTHFDTTLVVVYP